ncbi:benzoate 4-monooxygenase cytochrome P450 [Aspergillus pseudoustus]|uniref:Benzoate 4-monooxygenase cytochrome P450 n=1 Tax=Aspergillus pseudoustus TaxID=1810923 RepID=A0ABR4K725_9EURO
MLLILIPSFFFLASVALILQRITLYYWDPKGFRRYPGLDAFSGFSNLSYILQIRWADGFRTRKLAQAHQTHAIIRLGPNSLSFRDIEAIRDIYGHSTPCIKGDMYSTPAGAHRSLLDSVDKSEHSQKRKRLAAAFSAKHLAGWEFKVVDKCARLIAQFDKFAGSSSSSDYGSVRPTPVDFRHWANLFTVEAIADIGLSQKLGLLESGTNRVEAEDEKGNIYKVSFINSLRGVGRSQAPIVWSSQGYQSLKSLLSLVSRDFSRQVKNSTAFDGIVRRLVSKRMESHDQEPLDDFFACLTEKRKGESSIALPRGEIEAECGVFMNAGSDTTAIQLTHVIYYLLKNPAKLRKLQQELDEHIPPNDDLPSYSLVQTLPYLKACLDESLRLSPPVSFGLQRKTPPEGMSINNRWIPGNTLVSVPAYIAHRDESVFPNAETFMPERWLSDQAKEFQKYFIPFSAGSRGCIGRNITYLEQHVLIAALIRRFEFSLADPNWEMQWEERFNLWPSAMPVVIRHRTA